MKCYPNNLIFAKRRAAFTLVELLAALAFMALVIPVTMHALTIATRAGQVAERKAAAARLLDRTLNEYSIAGQNISSAQRGVETIGPVEFSWNITLENWREDNMRLVTCEVTYPSQGQEYSVRSSTLMGMPSR